MRKIGRSRGEAIPSGNSWGPSMGSIVRCPPHFHQQQLLMGCTSRRTRALAREKDEANSQVGAKN